LATSATFSAAEDVGTSRIASTPSRSYISAARVFVPYWHLTGMVAQGSLGRMASGPKVVRVRQLTSLTDDLEAEGLQPVSVVLSLEAVRADKTVAAHLEVRPGQRIHRLSRLRIVESEPLAIEVAHLPGPLPKLAENLAEKGSLYATLRDCYDRGVTSVEDTVETALATPDQAELLEIGTGQPLLLFHRTGRDRDGRVVEWTRSVYRGDRFRFVARA